MTTFWMIVLGMLYFLPWINAMCRDHRNTTMIFLTNTLFGWTGIGWLLAFIWSYSYQEKRT